MAKPQAAAQVPPSLVITQAEIAASHDPSATTVAMKSRLLAAHCVEQSAALISQTVAQAGIGIMATMIGCTIFLKWC